MKTPEEIKRGLYCCKHFLTFRQCEACPYREYSCIALRADALAYIQQLEAELEQTKQERDGLSIMLGQAQTILETRTHERDNAIATVAGTPSCETCAHYTPGYFCPGCRSKSNWQFCGVKEG